MNQADGLLLDLHAIVEDDGFRDTAEHMTYTGKGSGQDLLTDRLVEWVLRELKRVDTRNESQRAKRRANPRRPKSEGRNS